MNLSIIIPVYNCANYLKKGFEQLKPLYASKIDFEIIYVNDGSTDHSLEELKKIEASNKNVLVISQENKGSSGARNTAIDVAKGDYIQFLDSDDIIEIENLILLLEEAIDLNLDLIGYRLDYVDDNYKQIGVRPKHPIPYNKLMSGAECLIEGYQPSSICVFLFKRKILIDNNLRIYPKITHMDVEFMSRVMLNVNNVIFKDQIIYHYLQRPGSITKPKTQEKLQQLRYDEVKIAKLIKDNIKNYSLTDSKLIYSIKANYNTIIWNLLWQFISKPKELNIDFKKKCINQLKQDGLYPIKGPLKTSFQKLTRLPFQIWLKISL